MRAELRFPGRNMGVAGIWEWQEYGGQEYGGQECAILARRLLFQQLADPLAEFLDGNAANQELFVPGRLAGQQFQL